MTDQERIEAAADDEFKKWYAQFKKDDRRPASWDEAFEAGVAWRDQNPSDAVRELVAALETISAHASENIETCGFALEADQALSKWKERGK